MYGTITIYDFTIYEGDIEPLLIGVIALIIVYFLIEVMAWRKNKKITFYADVMAPVTVFILAMLFSFVVWTIQDWAILIPFIMAIGFIPVSLMLTIIKLIIVFVRKIKERT